LSELSKYKEFSVKPDSLALRYGNHDLKDCKEISPELLIQKESANISKYINDVKNYLIYK
jgi:hypothetical protein